MTRDERVWLLYWGAIRTGANGVRRGRKISADYSTFSDALYRELAAGSIPLG